MSSATPGEQQALLDTLNHQREHVFEAIQGVEAPDLRRPVLPSGWTCLGLVNHLSLDVERFWFRAVIAGEQSVVDDVLSSTDNAWNLGAGAPAETVIKGYRDNIQRADAIITARSLDAEPAWWPDFFGSWRLHSVRQIVLHVITETATHTGHLDATRELIDGTLHLVLTG